MAECPYMKQSEHFLHIMNDNMQIKGFDKSYRLKYAISNCQYLRFSFISQDLVRGQRIPTPKRKFLRWKVDQKIGLNQYNQMIYEERDKTRFKFVSHQLERINIIEAPWIRVKNLLIQGNFPCFLQNLQMIRLPQLRILNLAFLGIGKRGKACGLHRCEYKSLRKVNFPRLESIYLNWDLMESYNCLRRQLKQSHCIEISYVNEDQFNFREYQILNARKGKQQLAMNPQEIIQLNID